MGAARPAGLPVAPSSRPRDATEVEIRFIERDDATTLVEIEHRGWERLGADGEGWRDRNHDGWATLLPHYIAATTRA